MKAPLGVRCSSATSLLCLVPNLTEGKSENRVSVFLCQNLEVLSDLIISETLKSETGQPLIHELYSLLFG